MVLSEGTPEDAEKVWTALKGKPLQMVAHVISIESPKQTETGWQSGRYRRQARGHRSDHDGGDPGEVDAERGYGLPVPGNAGLLCAEAVFDDDERGSFAGEGGAEAGRP